MRFNLGNATVNDMNRTLGPCSNKGIMSGNDKGLSGSVSQLGDKLQDILTIAGIQIARWLIRNHDSRICG